MKRLLWLLPLCLLAGSGCVDSQIEEDGPDSIARQGLSKTWSYSDPWWRGWCPDPLEVDIDRCQSLQTAVLNDLKAAMAGACPGGTENVTWEWEPCAASCRSRWILEPYHQTSYSKTGTVWFDCKEGTGLPQAVTVKVD